MGVSTFTVQYRSKLACALGTRATWSAPLRRAKDGLGSNNNDNDNDNRNHHRDYSRQGWPSTGNQLIMEWYTAFRLLACPQPDNYPIRTARSPSQYSVQYLLYLACWPTYGWPPGGFINIARSTRGACDFTPATQHTHPRYLIGGPVPHGGQGIVQHPRLVSAVRSSGVRCTLQ